MKSKLHQELQDKAENYLYNKGYWICGQEVPMPLGICDAWGMKREYGCEGETMAIEVKISRTDFRSRSQKYKEFSSTPLGNYQYVLCPSGLIQPEECHKEWGLLWWNGERIINKKKAPSIEMTAQQKLDVLIYFLNNGSNVNRPKLMPSQEKLLILTNLNLGKEEAIMNKDKEIKALKNMWLSDLTELTQKIRLYLVNQHEAGKIEFNLARLDDFNQFIDAKLQEIKAKYKEEE